MKRKVFHIKNKFKLLRKRSLHRLRIFFKYHLKRSEKEPVFIIAMRRTGSNLLLSYLNSIPDVSFAGEVLNESMFYGLRGKFISKRAVLSHILHSIHDNPNRICGAKLVRIQMENHELTLEDLIKVFPKARFIVLYRESLLDQYVSLRIAEITNAWNWSRNFQLPRSIVIDRKGLEAFCASTKDFYKKILSDPRLKGRSVLLSYEELTNGVQSIFDRKVFPFMKLPSSPVSSTIIKQNTKRPEEIIENFEEIKDLADERMDPEREKTGVDRAGFTLWFTGLPCSGKTTLANAVKAELIRLGHTVEHLDGDAVRADISKNLGYSKKDRELNAQKIALMASDFNSEGKSVLVSLISPYRTSRQKARETISHFIEVYVRCPLQVCEKRDTKNMYRSARLGKIKNFTGVSDPYEEPLDPEIIVDTDVMNVESCVQKILDHLPCRRLTRHVA